MRHQQTTQGKLAALAAYDGTTGDRWAFHDLGGLVEGGHFANDLALDAQGQVYVTDSFSPVIYKLDAQGKASVFVRSEWFTCEGFNLNGIVWYADGHLLVNKHNSGELFRISTEGAPDIQRVALPKALKGADRVVELVSNDGWRTARIASTRKSAASFPTTAAKLEGHDYVLSSRLDTLMKQDAPKTSTYTLQKQ